MKATETIEVFDKTTRNYIDVPRQKMERLVRHALALVAKGLTSGAIPADNYNQARYQGFHVDCGTNQCVLGWADSAIFKATGLVDVAQVLADEDKRLRRLFLQGVRSNPTPKDAAKAIRRYLAGEASPWSAVHRRWQVVH